MKKAKIVLLSSMAFGTISGGVLTLITPTTILAQDNKKTGRMFLKFFLKAAAQFLDWLADKLEIMSAGTSEQHNVNLNTDNILKEGSEYGMLVNSSGTLLTVSKDVLVIENNKKGANVYIKAGRYQVNEEGGCTLTFVAK